MAEINIEQRPKRPILPIVLALIVIAAVAVAVYLYLDRGRPGGELGEPAPAAVGDTTGVTGAR